MILLALVASISPMPSTMPFRRPGRRRPTDAAGHFHAASSRPSASSGSPDDLGVEAACCTPSTSLITSLVTTGKAADTSGKSLVRPASHRALAESRRPLPAARSAARRAGGLNCPFPVRRLTPPPQGSEKRGWQSSEKWCRGPPPHPRQGWGVRRGWKGRGQPADDGWAGRLPQYPVLWGAIIQ